MSFEILRYFLMINFLNRLKFVLHNYKIFNKNNLDNQKNIILVEYNRLASSILSYSYLSNVLQEKFRANIYAYRITAKKNSLKDLLWKILSKLYFFNTFHIYKSFGVNNFICPNDLVLEKKIIKKINKIIKSTANKKDLLNLSIDNIYIGDLIYDSYLMNYKEATVNFDNKDFNLYFKHSLETFYKWKLVFKTYKVKSVIVSHTVYTLAIPLRIAVSKNIRAYQCSSQHLYSLSKKNLYAYKEFFEYKKRFSQLSKKIKNKTLKLAKIKIKNKFLGKDLALGSTISAYKKKFTKRVIKQNHRIKILIATHCFFNNPHPYGKNLFVDFSEWLDFLGKVSKKTNYDWYLKLHPDYLPDTKKIIDKFLKKYPNINYIPNLVSHHQLIKEGIDVALTCWGSIAHEYPLFNKLVVNASLNNPHINYNFCLHPKTIKEYQKVLFNLNKYKNKINKKDIYEFYTMNFILRKSWLLKNFNEIIKEKRYGYYFQFQSEFYNYWLKNEFNKFRHNDNLKKISKFIESNNYLIDWNKKELNEFFKKNA